MSAVADDHPDGDAPIDGQVLLVTAAKASVSPDRLPDLLARVQADLGPRLDEYRRSYECVAEDESRAVFLVSDDHWERVGDRLDLGRREVDAVRRAHEEQLRRLGSTLDRRDEFDSALDIRSAVVVGRP